MNMVEWNPACRSTRALHFCGQESLEAAVTWLSDHADDTGLDEPLLVPKVLSIIWHQTGLHCITATIAVLTGHDIAAINPPRNAMQRIHVHGVNIPSPQQHSSPIFDCHRMLSLPLTSCLTTCKLCVCLMQTEPKKKLTSEEAAQQAEELRKRIKAKNQVCWSDSNAQTCFGMPVGGTCLRLLSIEQLTCVT